MNKLLLAVLLIAAVSVLSCQKKTSDNTPPADTTARDSVSADATPNYSADYKAPPTNRIADAIAWTAATLNNRDSAGFWNSLTWEDRDPIEYGELYLESQVLWDSTKGSHVDVTVRSTNVFSHSVHETKDFALFAHAIIDMRISGAKNIRCDSLTAILRVDNGKWVLGSFSQTDRNKPFQISPGQ
jgi:hypothetical protein